MRLIDADAVLDWLDENWPTNWTDTDAEIQEESDFAWFEAMIDAQPTVSNVEDVVVAKWIDKPSGRYGRWQSWCSACGKHNRIGGIESYRHSPRCPHCGAYMKNGGSE